MKSKSLLDVQIIRNQVANKIRESEKTYCKVHPKATMDSKKKYSFMSDNLLDFFLTQISPRQMAEFKHYRDAR